MKKQSTWAREQARPGLLSSMPEPAAAPAGLVDFVDLHDPGLGHWGYDHLCYAVVVLDYEGFVAQVDQDHPDFTTVIAVDRARGIHQADPVLQGQSAARPDLGLVPRGDLDDQARWYQDPFPWSQGHRLVNCGPKVHASAALGLIGWHGNIAYPFDF